MKKGTFKRSVFFMLKYRIKSVIIYADMERKHLKWDR